MPATRNASRSGEFYEPALIGRAAYDAWHALGRPTMYSRAREQVRAILDAPMVDPLPTDIMAAVDRSSPGRTRSCARSGRGLRPPP